MRARQKSENQSNGSVSIEKRSDAHPYSQFAFKNKLVSIKCVVVRSRWSIRFRPCGSSLQSLQSREVSPERPNRSAQRQLIAVLIPRQKWLTSRSWRFVITGAQISQGVPRLPEAGEVRLARTRDTALRQTCSRAGLRRRSPSSPGSMPGTPSSQRRVAEPLLACEPQQREAALVLPIQT